MSDPTTVSTAIGDKRVRDIVDANPDLPGTQIVCTGVYELPADWTGHVVSGHGCGRIIDIPDTPWDIKTDDAGNVVSEHRNVTCPHCGVSTFVQRPV